MSPAADILIVGAGFSGIGAALRLRRNGFGDVLLLEAAGEVGGTWRDNTYPGCACDVPSHLYSFSFFPNPNWSRVYAPQREIFAYLRRCVDHFGLRSRIHFSHRVVEARFDEARRRWSVRTDGGVTYDARVVINATGPLNRPSLPSIDGLEGFRGHAFHSSRWPADFDAQNRRIGVIGTGASAIQIVPAVAPLARKLVLFQRTAPWVFPKGDRPFSATERRLFHLSPTSLLLYRWFLYWYMESRAPGFVQAPGLLAALEGLGKLYLRRQVADPELRAKLTPTFRLGCKRVLLSDDYYPALTRPNVQVVTQPLLRATDRGLVDATGQHHQLDTIVFATGFRIEDALLPYEVVGRDGRRLSDCWASGPESYLGIAVAGFPNWYLMIGPNTGLGHSSLVFMMESQLNFILSCLSRMRRERIACLDVRSHLQTAQAERIQRRMERTVWLTGCSSWYLDEQGRNYTLWPGYTFDYWRRTLWADPRAFEPLV